MFFAGGAVHSFPPYPLFYFIILQNVGMEPEAAWQAFFPGLTSADHPFFGGILLILERFYMIVVNIHRQFLERGQEW
ncbi:MAG: hypothetical protein LOD87_11760 [Planifilum fulgidum]